jgi:hypothetical protein
MVLPTDFKLSERKKYIKTYTLKATGFDGKIAEHKVHITVVNRNVAQPLLPLRHVVISPRG